MYFIKCIVYLIYTKLINEYNVIIDVAVLSYQQNIVSLIPLNKVARVSYRVHHFHMRHTVVNIYTFICAYRIRNVMYAISRFTPRVCDKFLTTGNLIFT